MQFMYLDFKIFNASQKFKLVIFTRLLQWKELWKVLYTI